MSLKFETDDPQRSLEFFKIELSTFLKLNPQSGEVLCLTVDYSDPDIAAAAKEIAGVQGALLQRGTEQSLFGRNDIHWYLTAYNDVFWKETVIKGGNGAERVVNLELVKFGPEYFIISCG